MNVIGEIRAKRKLCFLLQKTGKSCKVYFNMPKANKTTEKGAKKAVKPAKSPKAKTLETSGAFAVIETGGKKYRVSIGDAIKIEKINGLKVGDAISFDKVL